MRGWRTLLRPVAVCLLASCPLCTCPDEWSAWPAEPEGQALNLTALSRGFREDLSGAVWNPVTRTLWVCRNGKRSDGMLWVLEEDGDKGLRICSEGGRLGQWRGFGDIEGVTFASFREEVVFLIVEGQEKIYEVDVSNYGEQIIEHVYDTSPFLPLDGANGAEGITFVPDQQLSDSGFVDASGSARVSRHGMGGLMFVGHQNGGGIFVFDLNRATETVDFVGEYRVLAGHSSGAAALAKVVALEFDRSTGELYAWHGRRDSNVLSVLGLSSSVVVDESFREFHDASLYRGPSDRKYEGLALVPIQDRGPDGRALFLTVDDGKAHSLYRYGRFGRPSGP